MHHVEPGLMHRQVEEDRGRVVRGDPPGVSAQHRDGPATVQLFGLEPPRLDVGAATHVRQLAPRDPGVDLPPRHPGADRVRPDEVAALRREEVVEFAHRPSLPRTLGPPQELSTGLWVTRSLRPVSPPTVVTVERAVAASTRPRRVPTGKIDILLTREVP